MAKRSVTLCRHVPALKHGGGRMDLWAFSRADLASLLGVDERQIARLLKSGALDPTDLASIATYWRSHL